MQKEVCKMTKGELLYAIAAWAKKNHYDIDLETWDTTGCCAKADLVEILKSAECETVFVNAEKVMPNSNVSIQIPNNLELKGSDWNGADLVLHYGEKEN